MLAEPFVASKHKLHVESTSVALSLPFLSATQRLTQSVVADHTMLGVVVPL
jgi:hypothetical protein